MFSLSPSNTDPSVALQRTAHPIRSTPVPPMDRIWIESGMIATESNQLADGEQPTSRQTDEFDLESEASFSLTAGEEMFFDETPQELDSFVLDIDCSVLDPRRSPSVQAIGDCCYFTDEATYGTDETPIFGAETPATPADSLQTEAEGSNNVSSRCKPLNILVNNDEENNSNGNSVSGSNKLYRRGSLGVQSTTKSFINTALETALENALQHQQMSMGKTSTSAIWHNGDESKLDDVNNTDDGTNESTLKKNYCHQRMVVAGRGKFDSFQKELAETLNKIGQMYESQTELERKKVDKENEIVNDSLKNGTNEKETIGYITIHSKARESVTSTLPAYTTFEPSKQEQIRREIGAANHNNVQNILSHLMAQNFQLSAPEQNIKNASFQRHFPHHSTLPPGIGAKPRSAVNSHAIEKRASAEVVVEPQRPVAAICSQFSQNPSFLHARLNPKKLTENGVDNNSLFCTMRGNKSIWYTPTKSTVHIPPIGSKAAIRRSLDSIPVATVTEQSGPYKYEKSSDQTPKNMSEFFRIWSAGQAKTAGNIATSAHKAGNNHKIYAGIGLGPRNELLGGKKIPAPPPPPPPTLLSRNTTKRC